MNQDLTPIAFPISSQMHSFIELRDTLRCISHATEHHIAYLWLFAVKDLHDRLVGESHIKPVTPDIFSVLFSLRKHFSTLAKKYPEFQQKLLQACATIDQHAENIRLHIPEVIDFISTDAYLTAYRKSARNQDILGHKLHLPQSIYPLWHGREAYVEKLQVSLEPIAQAIEHLDQMLHAHVPWEKRVAKGGYDQITLPNENAIGLLIVGLPEDVLAQGIRVSYSGFRSTIRLRFSQWKAGEAEKDINFDQNYALMMVPIS